MHAFELLAEERIRAAIAAGELDDLPGAGKPLALDDLSDVPEELRAGFLLLKSAGVLPEAMEVRKRMVTLRDLIAACEDDGKAEALGAELRAASIRYEILIERRTGRRLLPEYRARALRRLRA